MSKPDEKAEEKKKGSIGEIMVMICPTDKRGKTRVWVQSTKLECRRCGDPQKRITSRERMKDKER